MATAVDSSVLLDLLSSLVPEHAERAAAALLKALEEGPVLVCECVIAEISPALGTAGVDEFLTDWGIEFVPSSQRAATLAGAMYARYLANGGKRGRVVPDFLIGAHAMVHTGRLLARDHGYRREYFRGLDLVEP